MTIFKAVDPVIYQDLYIVREVLQHLEWAKRCRVLGAKDNQAWQLEQAGVKRRFLAEYRKAMLEAGYSYVRRGSRAWMGPLTKPKLRGGSDGN
jgi:hypothetical protein